MKQLHIRLSAILAGLLVLAPLLMEIAPAGRGLEEEQADLILNITRVDAEDPESRPRKGVGFEIYYVASIGALTDGELSLPPMPTREELEQYIDLENLVTILTTDAQGVASYNFTQDGRPEGVYLIVEQPGFSRKEVVEPFFITLPTQSGGTTLNVSLKKTVEFGPTINQDVCAIDNDRGSFAVGQPHTWILRGEVPDGIATAACYLLTDLLDPQLTLEPGSGLVILHTREGRQKPLQPREHYELEEGKVSVNGQRLRLALTPEGMAYVGANLGRGNHIPEIRFSFRASINTSAAMGRTIPAMAHLTYVNAYGVAYDADSDRAEVHTGGFRIRLTDESGKPLAKAKFRLARLATEEELSDNRVEKETISINGIKKQVVYAGFYCTADLQGEKCWELVTGSDGTALACGLPYGYYYLVEAESPQGYNRLASPVQVEVNETSHLNGEDRRRDMDKIADSTIVVVNTHFTLPDAGGLGKRVAVAAGMGLIGAAGMMFLRLRKKV